MSIDNFEIKRLAHLADAVVACPQHTAALIEVEKTINVPTAEYLGALSVLENVCINTEGAPFGHDRIIKDGISLTEEEGILRMVGLALVWAGNNRMLREFKRLPRAERPEINDEICGLLMEFQDRDPETIFDLLKSTGI